MKPVSKLFALFCALALLLPACVTVRDIDGNRYRTLKINGMRWMAENLRTTHYADGSPIVIGEVADKEATGACYFDDWNSQDSVRKYGLLYTWAAAVRDTGMTTASVQGVCPDGWHLPDDAEWTAMTQGCVAEDYQYRIPFSAKNMRIIKRFVRPPRSGYRYPGNYSKVGEESFWWSSTPSSDGTATGRYLDNHSYPCPYVCFGKVYNGYSVRCVQDGAKTTTPKLKVKKRKIESLQGVSDLDTVTIPHEMDFVRSFYSFAEETQVNTWLYMNKDHNIVFNYCINALSPAVTFTTPNYLSHYILLDRNSLIYSRAVIDSTFYLIDNHSNVRNIIGIKRWAENGDSVYVNTSNWHFYVPMTADSGLLFCNTFLANMSNYYRYDVRVKMFSRPMFHVFSYKNGQLNPIRGMGTYPNIHRSKGNTRYNYHFTSTMNKDTDLVAIYSFIDSLYVIHRDGSQEQHYIHSKHQQHIQEEFDTANTYNYTELARTESAKTSYLGVIYDSYRNLYYITVSRPMPYENRDGTRNNISDKPWSLLVLDSAFRQIAEMDMPDCLSKHELMVVPKGIALADKRLSDDEKTCFVTLRYNEKDLYNTDIDTVRRNARGANKRK
jgi:uncharacterized protein (TIGR02145 family)